MNAELDEAITQCSAGGAFPSPTRRALEAARNIADGAAAKARDRAVRLLGVIGTADAHPGASASSGNASALEPSTGPSCLWTPLPDYSGDWRTGCGREWNSLGGTEEPRQGMRCFGCGKPVALPPRPRG